MLIIRKLQLLLKSTVGFILGTTLLIYSFVILPLRILHIILTSIAEVGLFYLEKYFKKLKAEKKTLKEDSAKDSIC
jgi:hypothetical protein